MKSYNLRFKKELYVNKLLNETIDRYVTVEDGGWDWNTRFD